MKYIIEMWQPITCRYEKYGEWNNLERAEIMMHKPYNRDITRRLIRIQEDILYTLKAEKNK